MNLVHLNESVNMRQADATRCRAATVRGNRLWSLARQRNRASLSKDRSTTNRRGNPAYKGALVYGRRSDGKHHWLEIEKKDGVYETRIERKDVPGRTFVHRTEEQCIVVEDCHEAL